ncbi:MAG: CoA transferase [Acetobacteraceae bacterium]
MTAEAALAELWAGAGLPAEALAAISFSGADPVLPSNFAVGTAAAASIGAAALAARELFRLRGGPPATLAIALRNAALECRSERYLRLDGEAPPPLWDAIAGLYPTADGWVRLHTNFPHHRDGILKLLGTAHERAAVARALTNWRAEELDRAATEAGLAVAWLRSFAEWDRSSEAAALAAEPLVAIERLGEAPPEPLRPARAPLSGVRVLDLTRVIAGPVAGRTLARYGADVLLINAPHLPQMAPLVIDTGRGKLSAFLDLRDRSGADGLARLIGKADIFLQSYRPCALGRRGFADADVARIRPGIVCASLSAYGFHGPWAGRRGFDSLVQTATGFNHAEAEAAGEATPKPLPLQALDHATGQLLAFGIITALIRRASVGGSWRVRTSLARTGLWLRSLGRIEHGLASKDPTATDIADRLEEVASGFGPLTVVRAAAEFSDIRLPPLRPAMPLGTHPAEFPEY